MKSLDVHASMYLSHAWLTSFAKWIPFDALVACVDLLELHGFVAVLALTISVLDNAQEQILEQNCMDDLLRVLYNLKSTAPPSKAIRASIKEQIPEALIILEKRERHAASDVDSRPTENEVESNTFGWHLVEAEAVAAGHALIRWAIGSQNTSSSRAPFSNSMSAHLI